MTPLPAESLPVVEVMETELAEAGAGAEEKVAGFGVGAVVSGVQVTETFPAVPVPRVLPLQ